MEMGGKVGIVKKHFPHGGKGGSKCGLKHYLDEIQTEHWFRKSIRRMEKRVNNTRQLYGQICPPSGKEIICLEIWEENQFWIPNFFCSEYWKCTFSEFCFLSQNRFYFSKYFHYFWAENLGCKTKKFSIWPQVVIGRKCSPISILIWHPQMTKLLMGKEIK